MDNRFQTLWDEAARRAGTGLTAILPTNADDPAARAVAGLASGYTYLLSRPGVTGAERHAERPAERLLAVLRETGAPPALSLSASRRRRTSGLRSRRAPRARFRARPSCGGSKRRFPMSRARRGLLPSSSGR